MLQIKVPKIKNDHPDFVTKKLKKLLRQTRKSSVSATRRFSLDGRGRAIFCIQHTRDQRVMVKVSYTNNTRTRSWAAHGKYLQRDHAQIEGEKGHGFTKISQDIDISEVLDQWQEAGDPRIFKVIISPENATHLDLQAHARELMQRVEADLGTPLEWIAIDHNNTEHGHVHLIIRGLDEKGHPLKIEPEYIANGFRTRSQEIATQKLGLRTNHDISIARSRQIEKEYVTSIDRSIRFKSVNGTITFENKIPQSVLAKERRLQEIKRLKYLESIGLATKVGKKIWKLSPDLEKTLKNMQLSNDIIKSLSRRNLSLSTVHNTLQPTIISTSQPLTGKVIGMGLENELHDKRYLLLESTDGQLHYIQATNNIVQARDSQQFKDGDIITLSTKTFMQKGKSVSYIDVENHQIFKKELNRAKAREL